MPSPTAYSFIQTCHLPTLLSVLCWVLKDKQSKGVYTIDSQEHEVVKDIANERHKIYI